MTKITYEIVEHDGGWAYRVDGVFSETFLPTTWPAEPRRAPRPSKSSLETQPGSRTKTRRSIGMTNCRRAMIDPIPTSRAEE